MKTLFVSLLILFIFSQAQSQDVLVRTNGDRMDCKVLRTDSINIYILKEVGDREVETFIPKDDVTEIIYEADKKEDARTLKPGPIEYKKQGVGYKYRHQGELINPSQIRGLLALNPAANEKFKEARGIQTIANIIAYAGGFMVGYSLGGALTGEDISLGLLGGGAALIAVSIPISLNARENYHEAIDIYNNRLGDTSSIKQELIFSVNAGQFALQYRF